MVELVVNGVNYQFKLASLDVEYVRDQARAFCLSHEAALALQADTIDVKCTQVRMAFNV